MRAAAILLAASWVVRTWRKERAFLAQAAPAAPAPAAAAAPAAGGGDLDLVGPRREPLDGLPQGAAHRRARGGASSPRASAIVTKPGMTLLEATEAAGLPIESGCRMGVCGADPVCVKDGMEHLSAISDDERSTLDRLGFADNTRMACCARVEGPVTMALEAGEAEGADLSRSRIAGFSFDRSIERVVVLGNGIAGVTAADHVRRRHPLAQIDLVAEEPHHLYNRMGIGRLIYGRSAMQGLYLNPDAWYDERSITPWLNTRARKIDRLTREVRARHGREAALRPRSSWPRARAPSCRPSTASARRGRSSCARRATRSRCAPTPSATAPRRAVVAGGGLLGLEAAYALHKLGLRTAVLERGDRLLRRQLDDRASTLLQAYLEGLGLEILTRAETAVAGGQRARVGDRARRRARWCPPTCFLAAAGIAPNAEIARDAGLDIARGVLVDERMRTSDPEILAAGDVAEYGGRCTACGRSPSSRPRSRRTTRSAARRSTAAPCR